MKNVSFGRRVGTVFAVASLAIVGLAGNASATHSWSNYHWARSTNPLSLNLGDNLTADWKADLNTTSTAWSQSDVLDTALVGGNAGRRCAPTAGMVEVCNAKYGKNGWLGLAQIWVDVDHITQGTAKMNDTYFSLPQYNTADERLHVMCQEVGHTFGLGHQDESGAALGTCMDYSQDPGSTLPNQHDYDELALIYGSHTDTVAPPTTSPSPGNSGGKNRADDRAAWGQLKEKHGAHEVYVRDFGNGQKLVTFVTGVQE